MLLKMMKKITKAQPKMWGPTIIGFEELVTRAVKSVKEKWG
jgi:hypothetical protein